MWIRDRFYIYPSVVVLVKPLSIPKTSSGKIQRQLTQNKLHRSELLIIAHSDDLTDTEHVAAASEHEKQLCVILSRILKKDKISVVDSFFDIGGESITGTELIGAIKETFHGVDISFEQLFSSPSIRELADYIEKRERLEILHSSTPKPTTTIEEFEL